jgi:hypothetical protein
MVYLNTQKRFNSKEANYSSDMRNFNPRNEMRKKGSKPPSYEVRALKRELTCRDFSATFTQDQRARSRFPMLPNTACDRNQTGLWIPEIKSTHLESGFGDLECHKLHTRGRDPAELDLGQ